MQMPETGLSRLSASQAQQLVQSALITGLDEGLAVSAAAVDSSGHLLAFARADDAFLGSIDASIAKARTAVYFRRDTAAMQQALEQGKTAYLALADVLPLEGGVPLLVGGTLVGGLGISGAASAQDGVLARAIASLLNSLSGRTP
ncbi:MULTISPECIES: heme-binding protein [unclassified Acidovorax]|uniref:GlcG/HbpS family heme-binding protein n=1 Tax=unclassified Acidovorax TaxID=2684926 RepID=UPI002349D80C|nr:MULTISPECIES: heme-binding protein [unclassified Acidovorax]WCM95654.1 heme-binding protein [Acidovorax sp. GBBC 1281]GKS95955.1 heme-binding protein [Acidovorax sp. SUPP2825]GKT00569.1 heme-binding protein [Acidovorax sp. SUPP3434]GKT17648.1 heme-binding protein [Acidovorax sp. SUPP2522]